MSPGFARQICTLWHLIFKLSAPRHLKTFTFFFLRRCKRKAFSVPGLVSLGGGKYSGSGGRLDCNFQHHGQGKESSTIRAGWLGLGDPPKKARKWRPDDAPCSRFAGKRKKKCDKDARHSVHIAAVFFACLGEMWKGKGVTLQRKGGEEDMSALSDVRGVLYMCGTAEWGSL